MRTLPTSLVVVAVLAPLSLVGQDASAIIETALRAMGGSTLQAIQYEGSGSSYTVGQAVGPGEGWPRFQLEKYVATVNYAVPAMREQTVRRDVENPPRGGGAGPFIPATGQGGMRPIPGEVTQTQVRDPRTDAGAVQMALTPHGFLKAAAANRATATSRRLGGRMVQVVSFTIGGHPVSGTLGPDGLLERIDTRLFNNVLGDMPVEVIFSDYRDYDGVKFPGRILQQQSGYPTLDLRITSVTPNASAASSLTPPAPRPAGLPPAPVSVEVERVADGVWFLNGGAPVSLLVEFADHVVVIEGPQSDERTAGTLAAVTRTTPGKPIRWVVNTHTHFDHSGGIRAFVAEGTPILTQERNKPYWERILANPFSLAPDKLARAPRPAVIDTVGDRRTLRDATMTLELFHVRGNLHDPALLMGYLPKTKMLIQADAFHPRTGAAPLAAPPQFTTNLVENVRRLQLDVEQVLQVHGGVEPWSAVLTAARQVAGR
jgi:glyoxylase-like metal-dependent hydrolase (beta-lactamase superfamily II)